MKRFLSLILCLVLLLTFAACGSKADPEALVDTKPQDDYNYPTIHQKFTRESLNAFPIKTADMTTDEMRQLIVDFMRFSKTVLYTPNASYHYEIDPSNPDHITQGEVYGGLPFMNSGNGNIYRLLDCLDEDTGVFDMTQLIQNIDLHSNTGPSACYWAWGRVVSSVGHARIAQMTHANGFLRVGPYTYSDGIVKFSDVDNTKDICTQNGFDTMMRSYAAMKKADGLVKHHNGVHMLMLSADPTVVYLEGTDQIDPNNSYVTIIDQTYPWKDTTNDAGDSFKMKPNLDAKRSFRELFDKGYLPFTYAELTGEKKVEETKVETTLSGDSITADNLFSANVTSNFGISDVYITLKNKNGNDVYRHTVRATLAGVKELRLSRTGDNVFTQGDLNALSGDYTAEVSVQLSTGERPVVYSGNVKIG